MRPSPSRPLLTCLHLADSALRSALWAENAKESLDRNDKLYFGASFGRRTSGTDLRPCPLYPGSSSCTDYTGDSTEAYTIVVVLGEYPFLPEVRCSPQVSRFSPIISKLW